MDDPGSMRSRQRACHLLEDPQHGREGKRPIGKDLVERPTTNHFHDQELQLWLARIANRRSADIEDRHDVGVEQLSERQSLALEAPASGGVSAD
jgi:hypothetical protein